MTLRASDWLLAILPPVVLPYWDDHLIIRSFYHVVPSLLGWSSDHMTLVFYSWIFDRVVPSLLGDPRDTMSDRIGFR